MRRTWRTAVLDDIIANVGSSALDGSELDDLEARATALLDAITKRTAQRFPDITSGPLRLLTQDELRLVLNQVNDCDALPLALTCRRLRDVAFTRWLAPKDRYEFRFVSKIEDQMSSVARLQWALSLQCPLDERTTRAAAAAGSLEVLQHLRSTVPPCKWNERTCEAAARHGHQHVLTWLRSTLPGAERCPWDARTAAAAAKGGHLDLLRWARTRKAPWDGSTVVAAAGAGNLELLEWARKRSCPWHEDAMYEAEAGGHMRILQWALDNDLPCGTVEFGTEAAMAGNVEMLSWLHEEPRIDLHRHPQALWLQAAASGKVAMLQWLHDHDYQLVKSDPSPCLAAADNGALESLQFLHEHGCSWNAGVCDAAALRGDLAILTYAHENGCPWSAETCKVAGDPGPSAPANLHRERTSSPLEVLQYLVKNGCPWHPDALTYATPEVVAWARSEGLAMQPTDSELGPGGPGPAGPPHDLGFAPPGLLEPPLMFGLPNPMQWLAAGPPPFGPPPPF